MIMKLQNNLFSIQSFIIFVTANLVLVSCGTYQTAYYEDGIYSSPEKREKPQIVIVERNNNNNFEENYFTKKLDSLERISDQEIFTDVDSYSSNPNFSDNNGNYNQNEPWGYQNDNVVVNVNLMNDPFWYGNGFGMWGWNDWGWNNWNGGWGWNRWNNWGWTGGLYNPYRYGNQWQNNRFYRNNTYGRRDSNNTYGRRNSNGIIRNNSISNRRNYFDYNQNSINSRRSSIGTPVRRSSTIRGYDSNNRNSNYSSRNNSDTNNNINNTNSSTRRSSTTTRSSGNSSNSSRGSTTSRGRRGGN